MALFTSPSSRNELLVLVVAFVLIGAYEGGYWLVKLERGPVAKFVAAAIKDASERVRVKFRQTTQVANAQQATKPPHGDPKASILEQMNRDVPIESDLAKLTIPEEFDNPFIKKIPPGAFVPHPMLSFHGTSSRYPFAKDYFGMRNDEDVYFGKYDPETRCQVLFTWSGNSEAAGFTHRRTIAQYIEDELNRRDPKHVYKSLNIATNGYALNDEILAYVSLAYALKPEFSITHSGITDVVYGGTLPGGFKNTGLIYTFDAYYRWVALIYDIRLVDNVHPNARTLQPSRMEDLIPGILKTYRRYREIVNGNGGEFIIGLAPYGTPSGLNASAYWAEWAPKKLQELRDSMRNGSFIDFTRLPGVKFNDTIHTLDDSARMFAQIYADEILNRMRTRKLSQKRMGAPGYDGRPCPRPSISESP